MPELKVYFDYVCPYCWIANANVNRFMTKYHKIRFEWKPWEILPETPEEGYPLEFDTVSNKLSRLAEEAGLWMRAPSIQPNSHLALLGFFYAKEKNKSREYHDSVFNALWNLDENIGKLDVLSDIAATARLDPVDFKRSMHSDRDRYERMLEESEHDADDDKISLVPTFVFGGKRVVGNNSAGRVEKFVKQASISPKAQTSSRLSF